MLDNIDETEEVLSDVEEKLEEQKQEPDLAEMKEQQQIYLVLQSFYCCEKTCAVTATHLPLRQHVLAWYRFARKNFD